MTPELDVREVPKPQRHPLIFGRFQELDVGAAIVLVNNHDPKHLRQEFERDHPGGYSWDYLEAGPKTWRVKIGKVAEAATPRVLCNTTALETAEPDAAGAIWNLDPRDRQLDANVISLRPGGSIASHVGPDLDVLMVVLAGSGELTMAGDASSSLTTGDIVWLPRRSERAIGAGASGLRYLTVHTRRPALRIDAFEPRHA